MSNKNKPAGPLESTEKPRTCFDGCDVDMVHIERLTIVGPADKSIGIMNQLFKEGYRLTRSGPYTDRKIFPKCDVSRFLLIAEREMCR